MISCSWMGIPLSSPIVLASLSLFSKPDVNHHISFFSSAQKYGVGAIILPSIHPLRANESVGNPHVRTAKIVSGLVSGSEYMGFSVLGTTDNIISIQYGLTLAQESVKLGVPVVGSIANIGFEKDFLNVVRLMSKVKGLSGLELNFSCPNVVNGLSPSIRLLEKVRETTGIDLPISIKLAPRALYDNLLDCKNLFQGITLSNAYTGLVPPKTTGPSFSPFDDIEIWRPTGVYGPQEKTLTFQDIWNFKSNPRTKAIQLSSVGGYVNGTDVIQAIMLGADSVQLSSAVFWNGLSIIHKCNDSLINFLSQRMLTLNQLKGISLPFIRDIDEDTLNIFPTRKMKVNTKRCKKCVDCTCFERGCYAFHYTEKNTTPFIDDNLCNGCGWCQAMCRNGAIDTALE